jgi:hypothetical protein
MKLLNLKQIAIASALIAGGAHSISANAQVTMLYSLYSSPTNINPGGVSLGGLANPLPVSTTVYYSLRAGYVSGPIPSPNLGIQLNAGLSNLASGNSGLLVIPSNGAMTQFSGSFITSNTRQTDNISLGAAGNPLSSPPATFYSIQKQQIKLIVTINLIRFT